ncbi:hypothetical protein RhiirA1_475257 [Rhizophagus irregularis]|uniref:Protein kinase domain-containing protein n=1 Tax=Rhizophagus irregularis TaxID=588596 RepID=A0A2N0QX61_9GLOM|nr:hypothetical protein RhiirA1_475257 [Rhizophagus irregularis]
MVYSAIWKDGPLFYKGKFRRMSGNRKVALKYFLNSSQNITDEFLNEIRAYSLNNYENITRIYGLSQNPDTKDYIIVLGFANGGSLYYQLNKNYNKLDWISKLRNLLIGNLLVENETMDFLYSRIFISDMGLCGEVKAYYTSRLLNPFTKNLYSMEVIDFTKTSRWANPLGSYYKTGMGTVIDSQKVFELYQKSANLEIHIEHTFRKGINN